MKNEKDLFIKTIENNKYIGVLDEKTGLYRITRKSDGLVGGYIEKLSNLSEHGNCFVFDNAKVSGDAEILDNAIGSGNAGISGDARISGNAEIFGDAIVSGNAGIYGNTRIFGNTIVSGDARIYGNTRISNGEITKTKDYVTMKNRNSSGRFYTYNYTSDTWVIGCFIATTAELVLHLEENANAIQKDEYTKAIKFVLSLCDYSYI